ncbi:MAG: HK97 family phage prohead protease [Bosea sp. (in: a-proteobacteria)]|nr:HK97 family phage prohead protease [Bosea sp. (in: a-proteobacteria)]
MPDGIFEGYASLFRIPDLGKDVVEPGAFRDSLARRGPSGVKLLWQHDPAEPLGRWLSLSEDSRGLFVRGRLSLAVARAREIHALMREGAIDGLSIGFRPERARNEPRTGLRRLERVDLWEVSIVTFPMLPQARVSAVKTAFRNPAFA